MLASITPLGERARGGAWWRTTTAYTIASAAGGALLGGALGGLGALLSVLEPRASAGALLTVAAAVAVAATVADLRGRPPSIRRQVDERWLVTYRDWVHGAGFGAQLGLGAVTIVTSASVYLTWALELASASAAAGSAIGLAFGLVRALPLLTLAGVHDPGALRRRHQDWQRWAPRIAGATVAGQAIAAVLLAAGAAGALT
ncbi:MAG: sulfite exporter TauE/SafE family protein [Frankiaceae bacterium]